MQQFPDNHKFYPGTVGLEGKRYRFRYHFSKNNPLQHLNKQSSAWFDTLEEGIEYKKQICISNGLRPRSMLFDYGDHYGIELVNLKQCLVDKAMYPQLKDLFLGHTNGYVTYTDEDGKSKYIHRLILNGEIIDHINGNKLDNRLVNLRSTTMYVNQFNQRSARNTSGKIGVSKISGQEGYRAMINVKGVSTYKRFKTFEEAVQWRVEREEELDEEFKNCPNKRITEKQGLK